MHHRIDARRRRHGGWQAEGQNRVQDSHIGLQQGRGHAPLLRFADRDYRDGRNLGARSRGRWHQNERQAWPFRLPDTPHIIHRFIGPCKQSHGLGDIERRAAPEADDARSIDLASRCQRGLDHRA